MSSSISKEEEVTKQYMHAAATCHMKAEVSRNMPGSVQVSDETDGAGRFSFHEAKSEDEGFQEVSAVSSIFKSVLNSS